MSQDDQILLFKNTCSVNDIRQCSDALSYIRKKVAIDEEDNKILVSSNDGLTKEDALKRDAASFSCFNGVPKTCPRITCYSQEAGKFLPCRRTIFVEQQRNESGNWIRLPCSSCPETALLSSTTKKFLFKEGK